jgi:Protein of unknown function (DUF1449)
MDILLSDGLRPFSMLAGFILLLLVVEIGLLLAGTSSAVELDADAGDPGAVWEVDAGVVQNAGLSPDEIALLDLDPRDAPVAAPAGPSVMRRALRLAGIGNGPLLVSLTGIAAGVAATGYLGQLLLQSATGAMLPGMVALALALVPGLLLGGRLSALMARLVPAFESHAISGQVYHGRRGHVVIGTARRGEPAQVRWRDSYGTTHSLMAEPLRDLEAIDAGTEVLVVKTRDRQPRIVALTQP